MKRRTYGSTALNTVAWVSVAFLVAVSFTVSFLLFEDCAARTCLVSIHQSNEQESVDRGIALISAGEYEAAESVLKKVLDYNPDNVQALQELAGQLRHRGRYAEAEPLFLRAIELRPNDPFLYVDVGKLYRNMHDSQKAIAMFKKAESLGADQPRLWSYGYAELYITMKEYDKAIAANMRSLELDPNDHYTYMSLGNIYREQKRYDDAIGAYTKSIEVNPKSEAYFGLGYTYLFMGDLNEAELWFRKYVDLFPAPRGEVYSGLGAIAERKEDYFGALKYYAYARYLDPGTVPGDPEVRVLGKLAQISDSERTKGEVYLRYIQAVAPLRVVEWQ